MENRPENWDEIARLIALDKESGLEQLRRRGFVPAQAPRPALRPLPWLWAAAASLALAAGLVSFWLLRGSWRSVPTDVNPGALLADSFLYATADRAAAPAPVPQAAAGFTSWAAALQRRAAEVPAVDPTAPVERGDPEEVGRRIGRAIRDRAFEQFLTHLKEFHDKEA